MWRRTTHIQLLATALRRVPYYKQVQRKKAATTLRSGTKNVVIMETLALRGDHITLAQAVKAAGFADSGGQAKHLVRSGTVRVNEQVETQPGKKLHTGDRFQVGDHPAWEIKAEEISL